MAAMFGGFILVPDGVSICEHSRELETCFYFHEQNCIDSKSANGA